MHVYFGRKTEDKQLLGCAAALSRSVYSMNKNAPRAQSFQNGTFSFQWRPISKLKLQSTAQLECSTLVLPDDDGHAGSDSARTAITISKALFTFHRGNTQQSNIDAQASCTR